MYDQEILTRLQATWPETTDYLVRVGQVQNDLMVLREMQLADRAEASWMDELAIGEAALRWTRYDQGDPQVEFVAGSTHQALRVEMLYSRMVDGQLSQLPQPFERAARDLPVTIAEHRAELASTQQEVAELLVLEQATWPKSDEYAEKQARLAGQIGELEREAQAAAAPTPVQSKAPAQFVIAPTVRGPGL